MSRKIEDVNLFNIRGSPGLPFEFDWSKVQNLKLAMDFEYQAAASKLSLELFLN